MNPAENDCSEELIPNTPEIPRISAITAEENGEILSESNCNEIKNEPPDNDGGEENLQPQVPANTTQAVLSTIPENIAESEQLSANMNIEPLDTNVMVKEESANEIDYNMPISKTPLTASDIESEQMCDRNATFDSSDSIENQTESDRNASSTKIALDEYLDGLATPLIPRLRVKTEFALQKNPQPQASSENAYLNKQTDATDTQILPPPPPLICSSNSNSDFVADGIATPRLSLASQNRLRVKTEFSFPPATPKHNAEESTSFPVDLIANNFDDKEAGEVSPSISDEDSGNENIPAGFFDDLLRDKLKERIQVAQNNELEEKYSDRLKELERLKIEYKRMQESKESRKNRKKQKKSKKKSRKRSKSRSVSPCSKTRETNFIELPDVSHHDRNKRTRISPMRNEMHSSSNHAHRELIDENLLRVHAGFKIKSEFPANDLETTTEVVEPFVQDLEEIEEVLTAKQKKEKAIKRATALLKHLEESSPDNSKIFSTFSFVSTVRKLPTSHSYVQQQMYENRSPLHTVNNVSYKFNSHTTRFNIEEWGLSALPPNAAKLAKLVGCDAQFIYNKLKTIKIPAKLKKIKEEPNKDAGNLDEEELIETTSSLYSNAMTQTDISEFAVTRKEKGYDIGIQVEPIAYSIGCQTLETQSPTDNIHKDDEAPIMKILHDLNENQLMAIHAFAELIKEPNANANAMEMYKIQMKILDIYKMSQIPSALATAQPPIVNNYTTIRTKPKGNQQLCIQSVKGADGMQFSVNDPRAKSAAYTQRNVNDEAGTSSNNESRFSASQSSYARSTPHQGFSTSSYTRSSGNESRYSSSSSNNSPSSRQRQDPSCSSNLPPNTSKHYGRGGLRR